MLDEIKPAEAPKSVKVVRDSTFTRFLADEAVITSIGRDLEVGFLQYGPLLVEQVEVEEGEQTNTANVVTEVARMRMAQGDFLAMVMHYIQSGISGGALKGDAIQRSIAEWTEAAQERK